MPRTIPESLSYLLDQMQCLGPVEARAMFGAFGVFIDGTMFALYSDDQLYLKVDAASAARFEALHLPPFTYHRSGKAVELSYRCAPDDFVDDLVVLVDWGMMAIHAALGRR